jgi:RNA polymerase sigma factor (TIGR02999 family)
MEDWSEITELLEAWSDGDTKARDQLIPIVFDELRAMARRKLLRERQGHTLQPTALVNELYLELIRQRKVALRSRQEFFQFVAYLIHRILLGHSRKHRAAKRGGGTPPLAFDEEFGPGRESAPELLALDDALTDLEKLDRRSAQVVHLHGFVGLTFQEVAREVNVSRATVIRDWNFARRWLGRQIGNGLQE